VQLIPAQHEAIKLQTGGDIMSEKKTITVRTQPQEVEIEGNIITNDELKELASNIRGGNAEKTTAELLRHLAVNILNKDNAQHAELIRGCHYRAACLEGAFDNVRDMIWPKDQTDQVLDLQAEKNEVSA
jgi:hypothetical protein